MVAERFPYASMQGKMKISKRKPCVEVGSGAEERENRAGKRRPIPSAYRERRIYRKGNILTPRMLA